MGYTFAINLLVGICNRTYIYSKRHSLLLIIIIEVFIGAVLFMLNHFTPMIADDYCMSIGRQGENISVLKCFVEASNKYFTWGGGVLNFFLQYFFASQKDYVFDIANTVMFLVLVNILYFFAVGTYKKLNIATLITILFILCVITPAFGQVFLWMVGSIAYLWMFTIGLLALIPLRLQMEEEQPIMKNPFACIFWGVFCLISGWTGPSISAALVAMYLLKILFYRKAFFWEICSLIGCGLGSSFLLLAPGNAIRASSEGMVLYDNIISHFIALFVHTFEWNSFLPLILFALIILGLKVVNCSKTIFFFIAGFCLIHFAMIAAPYYSDRVRIGPLLFGTMLCSHLVYKISYDTIRKRIVLLVACVFMVLGIMQAFLKNKFDIMCFYNDSIQRENFVIDQRNKGIYDVIVSDPYNAISTYNGAYSIDNLNQDPDSWVNVSYAHYYGIHSVKVGNTSSVDR